MSETLLCVSTAGTGQDPLRMRRLTQNVEAECTYHCLDPEKSRWYNARVLWKRLRSAHWDLVYLEGTGIAGGIPLILARKSWDQRYVVSSGDPVGGFFHVVKGPPFGFISKQYEKLLYRHSSGFIGWTPYLTGAALKMGAPRGLTIEGAVDLDLFQHFDEDRRDELKAKYGLDPDHVVCGVVGSLEWTPRQQYCYGLELVEALPYVHREDLSILIVGDGTGRSILEERVPEQLRGRVVFTGRVPEDEVVHTLNAMDVGFIAQTLDELGRYRLTTKLPEYLACGLPVAMSPIPGYYDYAMEAGWALPEYHPADAAFHQATADWLDDLTWSAVQERRERATEIAQKFFRYEVVRPKFESFVHALLGENPSSTTRDLPAA